MTYLYRTTRSFASDVIRISASFPRGNAKLADQMKRSSTSVLLNLSEGWGRWKAGEKRRAYSIALGELRETRAALDIAELCGLIERPLHRDLDATADELCAMFYRLISRLRE